MYKDITIPILLEEISNYKRKVVRDETNVQFDKLLHIDMYYLLKWPATICDNLQDYYIPQEYVRFISSELIYDEDFIYKMIGFVNYKVKNNHTRALRDLAVAEFFAFQDISGNGGNWQPYCKEHWHKTYKFLSSILHRY